MRVAIRATILALSLSLCGCCSALRAYHLGLAAEQPSLKRLVVAHRGTLHSGLPDNSLPGLTEAMEAGVPFLEVDVRRSTSGELFLFHDGTLHEDNFLEPQSLAGREVQSLSPDERRSVRLHAVNPVSIPLLSEALNLLTTRSGTLQLDLKQESDELVDAVAELIQRERKTSRVLIQMRNPRRIAHLKTKLPNARVLARTRSEDDLTIALNERVEAIELEGWFSEDAIARAHAQSVVVMFNIASSRCDSEESWNDLRSRGIDTIMTNSPIAAQ